ncbi:TatD family hydrolase [Sphingomonas sp. MMS24-JH45]
MRIVGIGESGLDYFYDHSDRDRQQASFRAHIAAAEAKVPIVVHTRNAEDDTAAILGEEMEEGAYAVGHPLFHRIGCFAVQGARRWASTCRSRGSSPSRMRRTFRKPPHACRGAIADRNRRAVPLASVPHRGKPGEPSFVADTAAFLAKLRGEDVEELQAYTADNFHFLFSKTKVA